MLWSERMWFLNLKSPAEDEVKAQMGKPSQLSAHACALPLHTTHKRSQHHKGVPFKAHQREAFAPWIRDPVIPPILRSWENLILRGNPVHFCQGRFCGPSDERQEIERSCLLNGSIYKNGWRGRCGINPKTPGEESHWETGQAMMFCQHQEASPQISNDNWGQLRIKKSLNRNTLTFIETHQRFSKCL